MEPTPAVAPASICPQCHQPVPSGAYFCPNCGKNLHEPPLSTSFGTQAWIYLFSIALPIICFLAISYWPGIPYIRSKDPKAKQIGLIAIALIIISTIVTFWYATIWINEQVQSATSSINAAGL